MDDTYGHPAGDAVLARVGEVVQEVIRDSDVFARMGGEEFAVLASGTGSHGALLLAERIRHGLESMRTIHEAACIRVTVSVGVATRSPGGKTATEALIAAADRALYRAKRSGRNRVARAMIDWLEAPTLAVMLPEASS